MRRQRPKGRTTKQQCTGSTRRWSKAILPAYPPGDNRICIYASRKKPVYRNRRTRIECRFDPEPGLGAKGGMIMFHLIGSRSDWRLVSRPFSE